jgi:hypothetical protein
MSAIAGLPDLAGAAGASAVSGPNRLPSRRYGQHSEMYG